MHLPCLRLHAVGSWKREEVRVRWVPGTHRVPAEARPLIEQAWTKALATPGVRLFDGPMCRMESWSTSDDGAMELKLSRTSYKSFLGTNLTRPELADRFGPSVLANPVGVSPLLLSSDGFALLGRRNATVAYYPNRVHPFSGALEPRDDLDVFDEVMRELREELGFVAADVREMVCTGIAEDVSIRQPELIFAVRSTRTHQEIRRMVMRDEHHGSFDCVASAQGIDEALSSAKAFTPVAVASILLFGRLEFGQAWFDRVAARFVLVEPDGNNRQGAKSPRAPAR
jgi:hypothetical protein